MPIAGDTVTFVIGLSFVAEALRLRLGWGVALKMLLNLSIDWLLGLVPGLDLILDTLFKAHKRNAALLETAYAAKYDAPPT